MRVGILADDLTSATDGAAPFVSRGHRCVVLTDLQQSASTDATVISINKASRAASAADAAERAVQAAERARSVDILYNTVDSTVRGHLGSEIPSALAASGRSLAVLAPAFPQAGRTTEGGRQLLRGHALENTEFGRDPIHPITNSCLRELFPSVPDADVRSLTLADIRTLKPGDLIADGRKLLIADATTQDDLAVLVRSAADPRSILWCGSPGLAMALADYVGAPYGSATPTTASLNLFIIGSVNPLSREQCSALMRVGNVGRITIDANEAGRSPVDAAQVAVARYMQSGAGGDIVLTTSEPGAMSNSHVIATALGRAVRAIMDQRRVTGLFLTGGDTAEAVLRELEIGSLELLGEIEPGIPVGRAIGSRPVHIITKAGGFGSPDILLKSAEVLRGLWLGDKT